MEDDDEEASNNDSADKKNDWKRSDDVDECCEQREENGTATNTSNIPQKVECADLKKEWLKKKVLQYALLDDRHPWVLH